MHISENADVMATQKVDTDNRPENWNTREQLAILSAKERWHDDWGRILNFMESMCNMARKYNRPKGFFTRESCLKTISFLLEKYCSSGRRTRSDGPAEDEPVMHVMELLRQERVKELLKSTNEDKERYIRLKKEIQDIEAGKLDHQLPMIIDQLKREGFIRDDASVPIPAESLDTDDELNKTIEMDTEDTEGAVEASPSRSPLLMGNAGLQTVSPSKTPLAMGNAKGMQVVSPSKSSTSFVAPIGEQISPSRTPGILVPMIVLPTGSEHFIPDEPLPYTTEDDENDQPENFTPDDRFEKSEAIKAEGRPEKSKAHVASPRRLSKGHSAGRTSHPEEPVESSFSTATTRKRRWAEVAAPDAALSPEDERRRKMMVKLGYEKVIDNKHAYIFKSPITGIMDYDLIVKKPKCYLDIKRLMDQNDIDDLMKLRLHFFLMLANSVMYNNFDSEYYGFAKEMFEDADKLLSDDVMLSNFNDSEEKSLRTSNRYSSKVGMQPRSRESSVLASTPTSSRPVTPAPDDDDMPHSVTAKRGRSS